MLYVTTRNHQDAFTSSHALTQTRAPDGGLYVPLNLPKLTAQELKAFSDASFGQCVAEMLNLFFSAKLTRWDVEFSVGRYPIRLNGLAHRIFVAETWHNLEWNYRFFEKKLLDLLQVEGEQSGSWASVVIRMGLLAGILGSSEILDSRPVDIAAVSGDFTTPVSAWYLREMGFPVGNIICCCNENNQFWDLICNGQMRTDNAGLSTIVPEADVILPVNLERLISALFGTSEAKRYLACCEKGMVYSVSDQMLQQLRQGLNTSVVSSSRVETTVPNVYKTHRYILSPASALAYSGLLDYRAKTGIARTAIVLSDKSPLCDGETVAGFMDVPVAELKKML